MTFHAEKAFVDRLPTDAEIENATQAKTIIASRLNEDESVTLQCVINDGESENVTLTPALAASLLELLDIISKGSGFQMIPIEANLTTHQAADLLNVPRPYLISLLEKGDLPFVKRGRHRYVPADDLFSYKKNRDERRSKALDELARLDAGRIDAKEERI